MGQLVFTFYSPTDVAETTQMIQQVVGTKHGATDCITAGHLIAKWRTQKNHSQQFHSILPTKCHFYIGVDMVRAVIHTAASPDMIGTYRYLRKEEIVWNAFIESLTAEYPEIEFGLKSGQPVLDAIEFIGDGTELIYVSKSWNRPSWGGVLLGGMLGGTTGAMLGAMSGTGHSKSATTTRFSDSLLARARYTNGLCVEGTVVKNSSAYHEMLANMTRLTK